MADINFASTSARPAAPRAAEETDGPVPHLEEIELLFFAYRDFIGDPDEILAEFGFGRAHHRVLHFVTRNPGMPVAELLEILKITKQSLARVLRELIDGHFIRQVTGPTDRRQRLLYATEEGRRLARRLAQPQSRRIDAALAALGPDGAKAAREFLRLMINAKDRPASPEAAS